MRNFTKLLFTSLSLLVVSGMMAQIIYWPDQADASQVANSEFDGGLNDWTTESVFTSDTSKNGALWIWKDDASPNQGVFSPDNSIRSLSPENGAAVFDSDFTDNGGDVSGGFGLGEGPCTVPGGTGALSGLGHRSELISPSMDLSATAGDQISLNFIYWYRGWQPSNLVAVAVSTDGGVTYGPESTVVSFSAFNQSTSDSSYALIDITEQAAGQSDVKVKFIFQGCYYYWVVDDVQIIQTPFINAALDRDFFGLNFRQPASQITDDTVGLQVDALTIGGRSGLSNAYVDHQIVSLDDDGNVEDVLWTTRSEIGNLPINGRDTVVAVESFVPDKLTVGTYAIQYTIGGDSIDAGRDYDYSDNTIGDVFQVTEDNWSLGPGINTFTGTNGQVNWAVGAQYRTSNTWGNLEYFVRNVAFGSETRDDSPIAGNVVPVYMFRMNDGLFFGETGTFGFELLDHPEMTLKGANFGAIFESLDPSEVLEVELEDFEDNDELLELEPATFYVFMVSYEGDAASALFHGHHTGTFDYFGRSVSPIQIAGDQWYTGWANDVLNSWVEVSIDFQVSADAEQLADELVSVSPNPTVDNINVNIDFDAPSEAVVILAHTDGRAIQQREFDAIQKEIVTFDATNLTEGTYVVYVNTPNGITSEKVIVTK